MEPTVTKKRAKRTRSNYIQITPEDAEKLANGLTIDIQFGTTTKKLTTKSLYDIKKEKLQADFHKKLAELEATED